MMMNNNARMIAMMIDGIFGVFICELAQWPAQMRGQPLNIFLSKFMIIFLLFNMCTSIYWIINLQNKTLMLNLCKATYRHQM